MGRGLDPAAAAVGQDRQAGRGHRIGTGRSGGRPAADPRRPRRRGARASRPHRRPAALRHPRVQDGEAPPRPTARPDAAEGTEFRVAPTSGATSTSTSSSPPTTPSSSPPAPRLAGPAHTGPRARRRPPGDGVPAMVNRYTRGRRAPPSPPRAASRHHGRRRHGRRLPRHRPPPGRRVGAPVRDPAPAAGDAGAGQPVAAVVDDLPHVVGPRGGRRAGVLRQHRVLPRRRPGRCGALRAHEVEMVDGRFQRSRAPTSSCPASWCCWRMGFVGPERAAGSTSSASTFDERGNVARDARS